MEFGVRQCIIGCAALIMISPLQGSWAAEQPSSFQDKLRNVDLCNGVDRSSPEPQINGCTALIDAGNQTTRLLAIAHNNRGNAYFKKGDYDRAIKDYDMAIELLPSYARPLNNRGLAYQKKGDYDRAIKDFDETIKLSPNYARAFANRADTYEKKSDYERAAHDYDDAIRLEPNLKAAWSGRCWTRAVIGQLQAALTDCNKALDIKANDAATYDARDIKANDAATYDSRGLIYLKMGLFDSAIEDYSAALRFEPTLASALYGRGVARLKKGDAASGNADVVAAKSIKATIVDEFARYGVQL